MTGRNRGRRRIWPWLLVLGGLVAVVALGGQPSDGTPFDPRSSEPLGTKALVELVEELGADVTIDERIPDGRDDPVIAVIRDGAHLSDAQLDQIDQALADGATLVITDPFSPLTPPLGEPTGDLGLLATDTDLAPGRCSIDPLTDLASIHVFGTYLFDAREASTSCYGDGQSAFVTVSARNGANVVAIGGTTPFTNENLGDADNAALIAAFLAPRDGTDVVFLEDDLVAAEASGDLADSPFDLVDSSVVHALVQLGIAFVVYALWRARRLGRPLREEQPVEIDGSELVAAVGDLLHRTGDPARAARLLRDDTRRSLCRRLGLPPDAPIETLAATVAQRTGVDGDRVVHILSARPVTGDDDLVTLARDIESLRQEILHEHAD